MVRKQTIKLTEEQLKELHFLKENKESDSTELKRVQAILLVDCMASPELIEHLTGYGKKHAFTLRKKYLTHGIEVLKTKKKKRSKLLTKNQIEEVLTIIKTQTPRDFGYESMHWTTLILGQVIEKKFGVRYKSKTSVQLIFKDARFSYHKPDKQYRARKQEVIDAWVKEKEPIIQKHLDDPNTVVLVEDEMMLLTQTTTQKIWLPQGHYPKIDVASKRERRGVYGFLNIKTGQEHAFKTMGANSEETCQVLDQIGNLYVGFKIVILWDNAAWHKSETIRKFLTDTKHSFHLINFPPYAPELNPQEHVWKAGRSHITHNNFIEKIDLATDQFVNYLNTNLFRYKFLGLVCF